MQSNSTSHRAQGHDAHHDFVPGWYAICSSRELGAARPLAVERFGERWVLFRRSDGISAFVDRCPHRGVALSGGIVRNDRIICPFHGFEYDGDGACVLIPAQGEGGHIPKTLVARTAPAREAHDFVFLWWGPVPESLPEIDWFDEELADCFGPYEFFRDTEVGLSRNIENQLDFTHLPFVHRTSIGRFVESPQMEVGVQVDGARIRAFRLSHPDFFVELRMPNLWINKIGDRSYVVLAFSPLDAQRTRLYVRYYHGRVRLPIVRDVIGWAFCQANRWILGQDIRVIETHRAKISPPRDGTEVLVPSDAPIIAYRKMRDG